MHCQISKMRLILQFLTQQGHHIALIMLKYGMEERITDAAVRLWDVCIYPEVLQLQCFCGNGFAF